MIKENTLVIKIVKYQEKKIMDGNQACLEGIFRGKTLEKGELQLFPHNYIGLVQTRCAEGDTGFGTGFLIGSSIVLTAAHNLYTTPHGDPLDFIPFQFCLNLHEGVISSTKITVVDYRIPDEYKDNEQKISQIDRHKQPQKYKQLRKISEKYDYALLKLENHIKFSNPLNCMKLQPNFQALKQKVTVCGYSEKGKGNYFQIYHSGELQYNKNGGGGLYDIDTERGQSGSPVYYVKKQQCYVVGIHKGSNKQLKRNVCTLIDDSLIRNLEKWEMEMNITFMKDKSIQFKYMELTNQLENIQIQKMNLKTQNSKLSKYYEENNIQKQKMKEQIEGLRDKLLESQQRSQSLDKKIKQVKENLNRQLKKQMKEKDQKDKQIKQLKDIINSKQKQLTDRQKQIKKLNKDLKAKEQDVKKLEQKLTNKVKQTNKVEEKFKLQSTEFSKLEDKIRQMNNQNIHLKNELKNGDKAPYDPIKFYQKAIKQNPTNANAHLKLALAYYQVEKTVEAFKYYEKASQLNKQIEQEEQVKKMFFDLANHYSEQQKFQKAIHYYKLSLESHPNKVLVYGRLSNAYSMNSQWSEAIDTCHKAIEFNPAYYTAYDQLQRLFASKGKAESEMNKTIDFIEKIALGRNSSNRVANETVKILKDLLQKSK